MAINFDRQLFFDPQIDIIGKEVPLAAMEKTGAVLQDRFDKSYENYNLTQEALNQAVANAHDVDKAKAQELVDLYSGELKNIAQKRDFHNMRHQTSSLARQAAMSYKTIAERNQKIQGELDAIAKNPKYALDPEGAKKEYLSKLKAINVNNDTRTISDFNVGAYNGVSDYDVNDNLIKIAPTLRTKTRAGQNAKFERVQVGDQMLMAKVTSSGERELLSPQEIASELGAYVKSDQKFQGYIARDVGRAGLDINTPEGQALANQLMDERINDSAKALGNMYSVDKRSDKKDVTLVEDYNGKGGGGGLNDPLAGLIVPNEETTGVGVDGVPSGYLPEGPQDLITKGVLGLGKGSLFARDGITKPEIANNYNTLLEAMDYNMENAKDDKTHNTFKEAKQFFKDYKKLVKDYPEWGSTIAEIHQSKGNNIIPMKTLINVPGMVAENVASLFSDKAKYKEFETKRYQMEQKYNKFFNSSFTDSDLEQGIQNYLKTDKKPVATSNKMIAAGITNPKLQAAFKYMGEVFNKDNVEFYKSSKGFDSEKPFEFKKVSSEPQGDGVGILFEVWQKDKDGKTQTALIEPNYDGVGSALPAIRNAIYENSGTDINLPFANTFKNVKKFTRVGETRTIGEIFEEAQLQAKPELVDLKLKKVKDGYSIEGLKDIEVVNGKPQHSKNDKIFSSYIEAIHALTK